MVVAQVHLVWVVGLLTSSRPFSLGKHVTLCSLQTTETPSFTPVNGDKLDMPVGLDYSLRSPFTFALSLGQPGTPGSNSTLAFGICKTPVNSEIIVTFSLRPGSHLCAGWPEAVPETL